MDRRIILITVLSDERLGIKKIDLNVMPSHFFRPKPWMRKVTDQVKKETLVALATHLGAAYYGENYKADSFVHILKNDVDEYANSIGMAIRFSIITSDQIELSTDNGRIKATFYINA